LLLANNHLDEATARDDETLGLFICNYWYFNNALRKMQRNE
jgi:hypothetical protein